jgi:hypothetical protein
MPERAEIEAEAAKALREWFAQPGNHRPSSDEIVRLVLDVADRVRDARDDDQTAPECPSCGQRYTVNGPAWNGVRCDACLYEPSPQGEDHGPEPDALGGLPPSQPKEDQ